MKRIAAAVLIAVPLAAAAQDMPQPKVLQGMGLQKGSGQWKVEPLEGAPAAGGRAMPTMTVCTDNLAKPQGPQGAKADPSCTHKLVKDTASEAVIEATCKGRTTKVTLAREGAKSVLMSIDSTGGAKGEPQHMKMRYTHLGACSAGQGSVTFDKNSQQCQALRQQAQMDPAATCARQTGDKERCMQGIRDMKQRFMSMCGG